MMNSLLGNKHVSSQCSEQIIGFNVEIGTVGDFLEGQASYQKLVTIKVWGKHASKKSLINLAANLNHLIDPDVRT